MEVKIVRTSDYWGKPCEDAYKKKYKKVDERKVNNPSKLTFISVKEWYGNGTNHRVKNGHIKRDFIDEDWFIKIDDIWDFCRQHGDLVISRIQDDPELYEVEIYDDYRE